MEFPIPGQHLSVRTDHQGAVIDTLSISFEEAAEVYVTLELGRPTPDPFDIG
jgi:hypothetical protein